VKDVQNTFGRKKGRGRGFRDFQENQNGEDIFNGVGMGEMEGTSRLKNRVRGRGRQSNRENTS